MSTEVVPPGNPPRTSITLAIHHTIRTVGHSLPQQGSDRHWTSQPPWDHRSSRLGSKIFCMVCFGTGHRAQHCPESRHGKGHRTREERNLFSKRQLIAGFISFICFVYRREMILKLLGHFFFKLGFGLWKTLENQ